MNVSVMGVDFTNPRHGAAVVELLDLYARDPMGGGEPLSAEVRAALPERLAALPHCRAWLAYDGDVAVGVCVAFLAYSTFQARPLLNVHDVAVRPGKRGGGVGKRLLAAAEEEARRLGCGKITMEVRVDNDIAQRCYRQCGYGPGDPLQEFWIKPLA